MSIYKSIKPENFELNEIKTHYTTTISSSNLDIESIQYVSGSSTLSGSYYNSLKLNFYLSGSDYDNAKTGSHHNNAYSKYGSPTNTFGYNNINNPQFRHKFEISGTLISIPQQYYGEYIKRGSFELYDNNNEITIKDDNFGNLYTSNGASVKADSTTNASSSTNYIGNIFYNLGIVTLTTTESWGSSTYDKIVNNRDPFYVKFQASDTIFVKQYTLTVNPGEFTVSNNPTARVKVSSSFSEHPGSTNPQFSPFVKDFMTGSKFAPFMTTIGFYNDDRKLIMIARYPQPIQLRKDMKMTFKINQDW
jgi:hypothetical protein